MSQLIEVKVPDIGDFADVPVIELFVKVGDTIKVDDAIATLESDKATMDVPSSAAGVVKEVLVQLGDRVAEGAVLIKLEAAGAACGGGSGGWPAPAPAAPAAPWLPPRRQAVPSSRSRCPTSATSPTCRSSSSSSRSATASRPKTPSPPSNPTRPPWTCPPPPPAW
jgi:pyruvate dehydrogenase E2 component (dihydrolipoamide acetyltransferase)